MRFAEEKNPWCGGGEGALIMETGERERERERERARKSERESAACRDLHKKSTSPKLLTGKTREADNHEFLQAADLKT